MAERRMFAQTIIDSDAFLSMPLSAQSLYFHLAMRADDDGFINNPNKIKKMVGAKDKDYNTLCQKRFILLFDSGVCVIKHWKINNYIAKDRYKPTLYREEYKTLSLDDKNAYTFSTDNEQKSSDNLSTSRIQSVSNSSQSRTQSVDSLETQVSIGKYSIDKSSIDKSKEKENFIKRKIESYVSIPELISQIQRFINYKKEIGQPYTNTSLEEMLEKVQKVYWDHGLEFTVNCIKNSIANRYSGLVFNSNNTYERKIALQDDIIKQEYTEEELRSVFKNIDEIDIDALNI